MSKLKKGLSEKQVIYVIYFVFAIGMIVSALVAVLLESWAGFGIGLCVTAVAVIFCILLKGGKNDGHG